MSELLTETDAVTQWSAHRLLSLGYWHMMSDDYTGVVHEMASKYGNCRGENDWVMRFLKTPPSFLTIGSPFWSNGDAGNPFEVKT